MKALILFLTFTAIFAIDVTSPGLQPEGVVWDCSRGKFIVGSALSGTIYFVDDQGNTEVLLQHPALVNILGLELDVSRDLLYAANSNGAAMGGATKGFLAGVIVIDLATKTIVQNVDLSSIPVNQKVPHFANDLAVDDSGNIYVTDSLYPQIWRVTPGGAASVYVTDSRFAPINGGIGLNGIAFHPNGFLLVGQSGTNKIYKVPLLHPTMITEVVTSVPMIGNDGLVFRSDFNKLIVVGNNANRDIWELTSTDNWGSATVTNQAVSHYDEPTTATLRDDLVYVTHTHWKSGSSVYEIEPIPSLTVTPSTASSGVGTATAGATGQTSSGVGTTTAGATGQTSSGVGTATAGATGQTSSGVATFMATAGDTGQTSSGVGTATAGATGQTSSGVGTATAGATGQTSSGVSATGQTSSGVATFMATAGDTDTSSGDNTTSTGTTPTSERSTSKTSTTETEVLDVAVSDAAWIKPTVAAVLMMATTLLI